MQTITSPPQANAEVPINENFEALIAFFVYAKRAPVTTGLTWGYYGGRWSGFPVTPGTLTLAGSADNYVVVARATGLITVSTATTNWADTTNYARVYKLTTSGTAVTGVEDHRVGVGGLF